MVEEDTKNPFISFFSEDNPDIQKGDSPLYGIMKDKQYRDQMWDYVKYWLKNGDQHKITYNNGVNDIETHVIITPFGAMMIAYFIVGADTVAAYSAAKNTMFIYQYYDSRREIEREDVISSTSGYYDYLKYLVSEMYGSPRGEDCPLPHIAWLGSGVSKNWPYMDMYNHLTYTGKTLGSVANMYDLIKLYETRIKFAMKNHEGIKDSSYLDKTEWKDDLQWPMIPGIHTGYLDNLGVFLPVGFTIDDVWTQNWYASLKPTDPEVWEYGPQDLPRFCLVCRGFNRTTPNSAAAMQWLEIIPGVNQLLNILQDNALTLWPRVMAFSRAGEVDYKYPSWGLIEWLAYQSNLRATAIPSIIEMDKKVYDKFIQKLDEAGVLENLTMVDKPNKKTIPHFDPNITDTVDTPLGDTGVPWWELWGGSGPTM